MQQIQIPPPLPLTLVPRISHLIGNLELLLYLLVGRIGEIILRHLEYPLIDHIHRQQEVQHRQSQASQYGDSPPQGHTLHIELDEVAVHDQLPSADCHQCVLHHLHGGVIHHGGYHVGTGVGAAEEELLD